VFAHYGVGLWVPEVGGAVDPGSEAHDLVMSLYGGMSKGDRTRIKKGSERRWPPRRPWTAVPRRSAALGTISEPLSTTATLSLDVRQLQAVRDR